MLEGVQFSKQILADEGSIIGKIRAMSAEYSPIKGLTGQFKNVKKSNVQLGRRSLSVRQVFIT